MHNCHTIYVQHHTWPLRMTRETVHIYIYLCVCGGGDDEVSFRNLSKYRGYMNILDSAHKPFVTVACTSGAITLRATKAAKCAALRKLCHLVRTEWHSFTPASPQYAQIHKSTFLLCMVAFSQFHIFSIFWKDVQSNKNNIRKIEQRDLNLLTCSLVYYL